MNLKQLFKNIGKNLLAWFCGAIIGIIIFSIYLFKIWLPVNAEKAGLGIIVLIPIFFILFSIVGIFVGGISGIVIYYIIKLLRK